jgi:hypothetical protein
MGLLVGLFTDPQMRKFNSRLGGSEVSGQTKVSSSPRLAQIPIVKAVLLEQWLAWSWWMQSLTPPSNSPFNISSTLFHPVASAIYFAIDPHWHPVYVWWRLGGLATDLLIIQVVVYIVVAPDT